MIILIILLLASLLNVPQPVMAVTLPATSSPLILVTPLENREQRQIRAIKQFFPKIEEIHNRMESRVVKMKEEGIITSKIESNLAKNNTQISTLQITISNLDTQINFGTPSASATRAIGVKLRDVTSKIKSIYLLQKQIIVNMKKLSPPISKTVPTSVIGGATNP